MGFDRYRMRRNRVPDTGSTGGASTGGVGQALFATSFGASDGWNADSTALTATPGASGSSPTVARHLTATAGLSDDAVLLAANRQDGRGFRHYRGPGNTDNGGGIAFSWGGTNPEIWMRYYIRFSTGTIWSGGGNPTFMKDWAMVNNHMYLGHQGGAWGFNVASLTNYASTLDWVGLMGSSAGDGLWHCFEFHFNIPTGVAQMWIDDTLLLDLSTVAFSTFVSFNDAFTGNQSAMVSTATGQFADYDDIVVTSTGRIGL